MTTEITFHDTNTTVRQLPDGSWYNNGLNATFPTGSYMAKFYNELARELDAKIVMPCAHLNVIERGEFNIETGWPTYSSYAVCTDCGEEVELTDFINADYVNTVEIPF